MALLTDAEVAAIRGWADAPRAGDPPATIMDLRALLADREERTRLLQEAQTYRIMHKNDCGRHWVGMNGALSPCDCGRDTFLAAIREAVKE